MAKHDNIFDNAENYAKWRHRRIRYALNTMLSHVLTVFVAFLLGKTHWSETWQLIATV